MGRAAFYATMKARQAAAIHAEVASFVAPEPDPPAMAQVSNLACPRCGKELKAQGRHFHIRACHVS